MGHVDRLADRSRDERLGGRHHLDVPVVVDEPGAVLPVLVGGVEDGEMLVGDMWCALDGLTATDVVVRLASAG